MTIFAYKCQNRWRSHSVATRLNDYRLYKQGADFENSTGISSDCLELLKLYLKFVFVVFERKTFTQKEGVCIMVVVAPLVSDICSSCIDQNLDAHLKGSEVCLVVTYVGDFLIVFDKETECTNKG